MLTQVPRPIPALSYAADKLYEQTARWYDAVCPILARHTAPHGRLVAVQVDNELAFFFQVSAYAADFSPPAIDRYRVFLAEKYDTIDELNATYGTSYGEFAGVDAPRRFEGTQTHDVPRYADWAEYRERYLVDAIGRLAGMLRERGLDQVALFHNYPHPLGARNAVHGIAAPFNLPALEGQVDFVGFDVYAGRSMYDYVRTLATYVVGTSRFPFVPELFAGVWPWYQSPGGRADEEFSSKAVLMHGIKGFSRYMLVERDRWLGSPIRRDGRVRDDRFETFRRINEALERHGWKDVRRRADVLLLANRDYHRLASTSVLVTVPGDFLETPSGFSEYPDPLTVSEEKLGFAEPVQLVDADWFTACARGLSEGGFSYLSSDTALDPQRWSGYRALVLSTYEYVDAAVAQAVVKYARAGGRVVIGPRLPHLDARMRPDDTLRAAMEAPDTQSRILQFTDLSDRRQAMEDALAGLDLLRPAKNDPRLEVTVHSAPDGADDRTIVFVANPTEESIAARVGLPGASAKVVDIWTDDIVDTPGGTLEETLPPYSIAAFDCRES